MLKYSFSFFRYLAPELLQGNYCLANDVFSLGVALLELSSNLELPSNGPLWQELRSGRLPETAIMPLSAELQSIIKEMMEPNPSQRPTVTELMQNPRLKRMALMRRIKQFGRGVVSFISILLCSSVHFYCEFFSGEYFMELYQKVSRILPFRVHDHLEFLRARQNDKSQGRKSQSRAIHQHLR